jgi:hypothetical protein
MYVCWIIVIPPLSASVVLSFGVPTAAANNCPAHHGTANDRATQGAENWGLVTQATMIWHSHSDADQRQFLSNVSTIVYTRSFCDIVKMGSISRHELGVMHYIWIT